jgi:hypothetical protein
MDSKNTANEPRSPLKESPLRLPGQSLDEERGRLIDGVLIPYLLFPAVFWAVALIEWWLSSRHMPHQPILFTACALVASLIALWRIHRLMPTLRALRQGRDGERVVGQALEELRAAGARIFHDVPADGFNLDHVLVMTKGIFVIETKTWSKRGRNPILSARAGRLYKNGVTVTPNPIDQACAQADWLRHMLKACTAHDFAVRGVVLFPGWWVEPIDAETKTRAWVLNPKALRAFLAGESETLSAPNIALAAHRIALHIQGSRLSTRPISDFT